MTEAEPLGVMQNKGLIMDQTYVIVGVDGKI